MCFGIQNQGLSLNTPCLPHPPRNVTKLFTGLLQPTLQEGTDSFVSPTENPPPLPRNVTKFFILDFNCKPLGRVPICFMSVERPQNPSLVMNGVILGYNDDGDHVPELEGGRGAGCPHVRG